MPVDVAAAVRTLGDRPVFFWDVATLVGLRHAARWLTEGSPRNEGFDVLALRPDDPTTWLLIDRLPVDPDQEWRHAIQHLQGMALYQRAIEMIANAGC